MLTYEDVKKYSYLHFIVNGKTYIIINVREEDKVLINKILDMADFQPINRNPPNKYTTTVSDDVCRKSFIDFARYFNKYHVGEELNQWNEFCGDNLYSKATEQNNGNVRISLKIIKY